MQFIIYLCWHKTWVFVYIFGRPIIYYEYFTYPIQMKAQSQTQPSYALNFLIGQQMAEKHCISKSIDCIKKPRPPPTNPWSIASDMKIESDRWKNTHQIEIGHLNCIVMKMQKISHFCIFALNILNKVDSDHAYVQWILHLITYNGFAGLGNQWDTWVSWKKKHIYIYTIYMSTLPLLIQWGVYKIISK